MSTTATIKPAATDWLALRDGVGHAQPRYGRERTVCGEPRIDPRFAHPIKERCGTCIERDGITVSVRPSALRGDNVEPVSQIAGAWAGEATDDWAPGELVEAFGR